MNRTRTVFALAFALLGACRTPPPRVAMDREGAGAPSATTASASITGRILAVPEPAEPIVSIRVVFDTGSADDPAGREGLTNLTAQLMLEGGTASMDYAAFTRALFPMAASISEDVDRDTTVFHGQVHRDHLEAFLPIFVEMLTQPRLGQQDFDRIRTQVLSALTEDLRGGDDEALGREFLQSMLYEGHPYGHPPLGTETGLAALTLAAVRDQHASRFCGARMHVGLSGAFPADLPARLATALAPLDRASCAPRGAVPRVARDPGGPRVWIVDKPTIRATAISFGFPIPITRASGEHAAVQFATNYLGLHRQSSGVLYQTLREARGLNYGDYAYAEHFEQDGWNRNPRPHLVRRLQYASVWLRPVPPAQGHFALRAAVRALHTFLQDGITEAQFEAARTFFDGYVGLAAPSASARLGFTMDQQSYGLADTDWAHWMRRQWRSLDSAMVVGVARRYLTDTDLSIVIVAPDAAALAHALSTDAPSPIHYDSPKPDSVLAEDREIERYPLRVDASRIRIVPLANVFH